MKPETLKFLSIFIYLMNPATFLKFLLASFMYNEKYFPQSAEF